MKTFKWFTKFRYENEQPHDVEHGTITVNDDGSLRVEVDDDYYSGEIDVDMARNLAEAILLKHPQVFESGKTLTIDMEELKEKTMNEEARKRRMENFPRNLVPVIEIDGHEHELTTRGPSGLGARLTMQGLANYLGELTGEEWIELRKLGAFRGDEATIRLVQSKIDDIVRTLLLVVSDRAWNESEFTLNDLRDAAETASYMVFAYREQARSMSALHSRIDKIEETQVDHENELDRVELELQRDGFKNDIQSLRTMVINSFSMADRDEAKELPLAVLIARLIKRVEDDPQWDATDGAHPAWWRGCDHGVKQTCEKLQRVATGEFFGKPSFASEDMNALAGDILGLRGTVTTLSNILKHLRVSTVLNQPKPEFLTDEMWEDLTGIYERLKSG